MQVTLTPGMSWKGDKGIVHMRQGKLRRAAEHAGLRDVEVTTFGAFPPALANKDWGRRLECAARERAGLGPRQGVRRGERHRVRPC